MKVANAAYLKYAGRDCHIDVIKHHSDFSEKIIDNYFKKPWETIYDFYLEQFWERKI
jgi:hypothetical protein